MRKLLISIAAILMAVVLSCCTRGFDRDTAEDILQKKEISEDEYDVLLQQYEYGIDDAIKFSKMEPGTLSEDNREEIITMFSIGKRLAVDEEKLTESQLNEFKRINHKGMDELRK